MCGSVSIALTVPQQVCLSPEVAPAFEHGSSHSLAGTLVSVDTGAHVFVVVIAPQAEFRVVFHDLGF